MKRLLAALLFTVLAAMQTPIAGRADTVLKRAIDEMFAAPAYQPGPGGIDVRLMDFPIEQRTLGFLYLSALKELYGPLQVTTTAKVVEGRTDLWYSRGAHYFQEWVAEPFSVDRVWRAYFAFFPNPNGVLQGEIDKLRSFAAIEELRHKLFQSLLGDRPDREAVYQRLVAAIEAVPGNSFSARDKFLRELFLSRDSQIADIEDDIRYEIAVGERLKREFHWSPERIARTVARARRSVSTDTKSPYVAWAKAVPILQGSRYRHFADQQVPGQAPGILSGLTSKVALRIYINDRASYQKEVLESGLPLTLLEAWRSAESLSPGERDPLLREALFAVSSLLSDRSRPLVGKSRSRIESLQSIFSQRFAALGLSVEGPRAKGEHWLEELFEGRISVRFDSGEYLRSRNLDEVIGVASTRPAIVSLSFSATGLSITADQNLTEQEISITQRCNGAYFEWSKRFGLVPSLVVRSEFQPITCADDRGVMIRTLNEQRDAAAVIAAATPLAMQYFGNLLGLRTGAVTAR